MLWRWWTKHSFVARLVLWWVPIVQSRSDTSESSPLYLWQCDLQNLWPIHGCGRHGGTTANVKALWLFRRGSQLMSNSLASSLKMNIDRWLQLANGELEPLTADAKSCRSLFYDAPFTLILKPSSDRGWKEKVNAQLHLHSMYMQSQTLNCSMALYLFGSCRHTTVTSFHSIHVWEKNLRPVPNEKIKACWSTDLQDCFAARTEMRLD